MTSAPLFDPALWETAGVVSSQSRGTALSQPANPNEEGAWTELTAATTHHWSGFWIIWTTTEGSWEHLDIGLGTGGSEVVKVENIVIGSASGYQGGAVYVPVQVPAGSRVAARTQHYATPSVNPRVLLVGKVTPRLDPRGFSKAIGIGADETNSAGTNVDPGPTAHTKGSWAELVASLSDDVGAVIVCTVGWQTNQTAYQWLTDAVGVGAAGGEDVVVPDLPFLGEANNDTQVPAGPLGPFPCFIPAGSRVASRGQCSGTSDGWRDQSVSLLGLVR